MLTRTIRRHLHGLRRVLPALAVVLAMLGSGIAGVSAAGASTSTSASKPPPLKAEPPLSQDLSGTLPNLNYGQPWAISLAPATTSWPISRTAS